MPDRYASLKQGLVGAWIPSISGSGLLLPDLSGRGNNGQLTNMDASDWVSSQYGRALDFDGVDDRIAVGTSSDFATNSQTISAWINPGSVSNPDKAIVAQIDAAGNIGRAFRQYNQQLQWTIASASQSFRVWRTGNAVTTGWQHVALSYTGVSDPTIWRNASPQTVTLSLSSGSPSLPVAQVMSLGYDGGFINTLYNFLGIIDDVRIYNRALSEPEIRLLSSEPGIGFKPAKKLSRFSQRFSYKPPKARNYGLIRNRDPDTSSLKQGLVGAWIPSVSGSGLLLPDLSGYGNNGTLTNMDASDWVSSQYGRALDFDGTDDNVDFGSSSILNCVNGLTISLWAKRNGAGGGLANYHAWLQRFGGSTTGYQLYVPNSDNVLRFYTNTIVVSSYTMSDTEWHHLLVTNNGTTTRIYVDGIQRGSASQSLVDVPTSTTNNFGRFGTSGAANGQLDDIRIYNRALTESEIRLLASRPGIGLEPRKPKLMFHQFPSGTKRRLLLTGQT